MNTQIPSMQTDHVSLRVTNFEATLNWYKEKLGFTEEVVWTVEGLSGMQFAYLKLNGSRIEIVGGDNSKPLQKPPLIFRRP